MASRARYRVLLCREVLEDPQVSSRILGRIRDRLPDLVDVAASVATTRVSWVAVDPHDVGRVQPWALGMPLPEWACGAVLTIARA